VAALEVMAMLLFLRSGLRLAKIRGLDAVGDRFGCECFDGFR
jgi:hypothetical protein